jgi:hypothetical protein
MAIRMTHCQVKGTGCGTAWHIARLHWSWYHMTHCQLKYTGCDTVWHIARLHWSLYHMTHCQFMASRPVPFTWHYVMWYHDQCNSHGNVSYSTTTSVFHLAICHTVTRQCISPGNVSYGIPRPAVVSEEKIFMWISHSVLFYAKFGCGGHLGRRAEPLDTFLEENHPMTISWYHDQCLAHDNVSYGTTTSAFHMALCHVVSRPVYFTWQCVIR